MRIFIGTLLLCVSFGTSALAQQSVQVTIDGQTYNCKGDSAPPVSCEERVSRAENKYNVCKNLGKSTRDCFQDAYLEVPAKECAAWANICNSTCKSIGYASTFCYANCY